MGGSMSMPGMFLPHHQPPHHLVGPHRNHSPAPSFSHHGMHMTMPLSGQNTGSHGYGHVGASPLAGSLSVGGGDPIARVGSSASNPHGISPRSLTLALPRVPTPGLAPGQNSRSASSQGHRSMSSSSSHIPLPPNGAAFARHSFSGAPGLSGEVPFPHRASVDHGNVPHLEGLGQRRMADLGPPETLHDRVIFVTNVSSHVFCRVSSS
jgi:hypothetical protein